LELIAFGQRHLDPSVLSLHVTSQFKMGPFEN